MKPPATQENIQHPKTIYFFTFFLFLRVTFVHMDPDSAYHNQYGLSWIDNTAQNAKNTVTLRKNRISTY